MSTVTFAMPVALDGPSPRAPKHNLFTVADLIDDRVDLDRVASQHWASGVTVWPYPPDTPSGFDPCSEGTFRSKDTGTAAGTQSFAVFTAYIAETCASMSIGPWEAWKQRAGAVLEATSAWAAEQQLSQGLPLGAPSTSGLNPYLADTNVTVLGTGALAPQVGLSYLEDAIAATGRQGVIHATPAIVTAWSDQLSVDGDMLVTVCGTPVVCGTGYVDAVPEGENPLNAGEGYAFATGPVQYRLSQIIEIPESLSEATDRSDNTVTYRAERDILVGWDTQLQAAVLVDWIP